MNTTLEDRLRQHYDDRTRDLPSHGPGIDDAQLVRIDSAPTSRSRRRAARTAWAVGSVAAATVLGLVLLDRGPDEVSPGLAPAEVLPDGTEGSIPPVTVEDSGPSGWYRLQPDLEVTWYLDPTTGPPSNVCWRTPVGSECVPDGEPGALPLVVPTAGGQTLVVALWTSGGETLEVQLASGDVLAAPVEVDASIGWGVARFLVPAGDTIRAVDGVPI